MKTFEYFISYYRPYKKVFVLDLVCALTISVIDVLFPLFLDYVSNNLFLRSSLFILKWLPWIAVGMLLIYAVRSFCRSYVSAQGHIMGANMERDMRSDLFDQFQRLSFTYYDKHNTGIMMSRMTNDLFDIAEFAHHGPENLFISSIKIIGSFAIMFALNVPLTLALLVVTLILLGFSYSQNKKMKKVFMDNRKKIGEINASLQDSLEGVRVVKSFANEEMEKEKFSHSNQRYFDSKKANYQIMGFYYGGTNFFQGMLYATIVVIGGLLIADHRLSPIDLATFALYINVFVSPLEVLVEFTEMFQKGFSGFKRFEEVREEDPDVKNKPNAKELKQSQGHIQFQDVGFAYEENKHVLNHIDIDIPSGKKVALVGPSGGGKSTLCSLVPRFYDVDEGAVLIDGQNVKEFTLHSLRQQIGVVQQDVYLFNGTIKDNIAYGKPGASLEEVIEAAKKANIHDFIKSLPLGYETSVQEKGVRLSGGQKQRISIARIFLKDPKILILDEATSALDNESERIIQRSLDRLAKDRTCITIAHRLSTIRNADEIIVIDEEGIQERGSHEELLKKGGIYARYYALQFEGIEDEV